MITTLTLEDALYLAEHMREIDKREIRETMRGDDLAEFAHECVALDGWCYKDSDGLPVAMMGVAECWPGVSSGWMVATDDIGRHGVGITKLAQSLVTDKKWHRIQAASAAFHDVSHAWLELLGFTRGQTMRQFGKNKADFIMFEKVVGDV